MFNVIESCMLLEVLEAIFLKDGVLPLRVDVEGGGEWEWVGNQENPFFLLD